MLQINFFNVLYDTDEQGKYMVYTKATQIKIIPFFHEYILWNSFPISHCDEFNEIGSLFEQELQMIWILSTCLIDRIIFVVSVVT